MTRVGIRIVCLHLFGLFTVLLVIGFSAAAGGDDSLITPLFGLWLLPLFVVLLTFVPWRRLGGLWDTVRWLGERFARRRPRRPGGGFEIERGGVK